MRYADAPKPTSFRLFCAQATNRREINERHQCHSPYRHQGMMERLAVPGTAPLFFGSTTATLHTDQESRGHHTLTARRAVDLAQVRLEDFPYITATKPLSAGGGWTDLDRMRKANGTTV